MSCVIVKASPSPSIARPLKLCFWYAHCIWFLNQKSVTPNFNHPVGGGLGFGNLVVMIVFRFDGGVSLELPGSILIWARSAFIFLPFGLRQMGRLGNVDWTVGGSVISMFYDTYKESCAVR
jgi:hypothetical protein